MLKKLPAAVLALIMILASVMLPSLAAAEEAPGSGGAVCPAHA